MLLVCDLGNTMIKFGIFEKDELVEHFSFKTDRNKSGDEYKVLLNEFLKRYVIEGAIISSVVPSLTESIKLAIKKITDKEPLVISKILKTKMPIKIDNPSELGSDMLVGAIGANRLYGNGVLVADLGTATKIYVIDKNGSFIGGIINVGVETGLKSLVSSTSLLLETPLIFPKKIIGKSTKDCIESGIMNSTLYSLKGFAIEMEKELGYPLKKVISGGFCRLFSEKLDDFIVNDDLNLIGLKEVYRMNSYEK